MARPTGVSERVDDWLVANVGGATAPFSYSMIAGGHSNLTFAVDDGAGHRYVLRRPPLGHRLQGAHDMSREHRLISAMSQTPVPVPPALGLCTDPDVNELPFYVMGWVDGHVLRSLDDSLRMLDVDGRQRASESLVDTMAEIHAVEPDAIGLGDLGRRDGYIERQLRRWYENFNAQRTRDTGLVDEVHAELGRRIPAQGPATVVHGDYRLDNTMIGDDGAIVAVLDWEICTLGDPLADLGLLMVYWTGPEDHASSWTNPVATADGFLSRRHLAERYASTSGRDISQLDYYEAFGYWKLACIIEGVYARYLGGALGQRDPSELEPFRIQVDASAERAAELLGMR